jgi:hypothetical protein
VAAGHTGKIERGRRLAEMTLQAFTDDWRELSAGRVAMADGPLRRLSWRTIDHLGYTLTLARLRNLYALVGLAPNRGIRRSAARGGPGTAEIASQRQKD